MVEEDLFLQDVDIQEVLEVQPVVVQVLDLLVDQQQEELVIHLLQLQRKEQMEEMYLKEVL